MAALTPSPRFQAFTAGGDPLVGGRLYTYVSGTSTPAATYNSSAATTANTNPVILDARGEADVWLAEGVSYKFVLKDASDATIWTREPVSVSASGGSGGGTTLPSQAGNAGKFLTTDGTALSWGTPSIPDAINTASFVLEEEFLYVTGTTPGTYSNPVPSTRLYLNGSTLAPTLSVTSGEPDHPGVSRWNIGNGVMSALYFGPASNSAGVRVDQIDRFVAIVKFGKTTGTNFLKAGFGAQMDTWNHFEELTFGGNGIGFSAKAYNAAGNPVIENWKVFAEKGGVQSLVSSSVPIAAADTWYRLEAVRASSGDWSMYINGSLVATITSAQAPTASTGLNAGLTSGRGWPGAYIDVDYLGVALKGAAGRY